MSYAMTSHLIVCDVLKTSIFSQEILDKELTPAGSCEENYIMTLLVVTGHCSPHYLLFRMFLIRMTALITNFSLF